MTELPTYQKGQLRVILADKSRLFMEGIRLALEGVGVRVQAETRSPREAFLLVGQHRPNVLIIDAGLLRAEDHSGFDHLKAASLASRILVLGTDEDPQGVALLLRSGVAGYLYKDMTSEQLLRAIVTIVNGQTLIEANLLDRVLDALEVPSINKEPVERSAEPLNLTGRELDVLGLLAEGRSNREIAVGLNISLSTVKSHVHSLLNKLNVTGRIEAADRFKAISMRLH